MVTTVLPVVIGVAAGVALAALILFVMSEHFDSNLADW